MVVETSLLALGQITENLLGAKKGALLAVGLTRCLQSCSGTASNHRLRCQIVAVKAVEEQILMSSNSFDFVFDAHGRCAVAVLLEWCEANLWRSGGDGPSKCNF